MATIPRRYKIFGGLLVLLLAANLAMNWPSKKSAVQRPLGQPPAPGLSAPGPTAEMREKFEAALQKLPAEQRLAVEKRMSEDRAFFESVKALPEQERRKKVGEHFAQNPPPQIPGFAPGPPPGGGDGAKNGPGGPDGGPGSGHIPPPEVRRSMDQHIVDSQKSANNP